jgi:hypothetical protein
MCGVRRVRARAAFLALGLALWLAPPTGAVSQVYGVGPASQFTPAGGEVEALSGGFEIEFAGLCFGDPPDTCLHRYRFSGLELTSDGLDLTLTPHVPIPGLTELSLPELEVDLPDPPELDDLVVERTTLPPQVQGEQRFRDLVLRTSALGIPSNQFVFDPAGSVMFPSGIAFDLELLEIVRVSFFNGVEDRANLVSNTTLGTLSLSATPVPEPHSAVLLGGGLAVLAATSLRRPTGPRSVA